MRCVRWFIICCLKWLFIFYVNKGGGLILIEWCKVRIVCFLNDIKVCYYNMNNFKLFDSFYVNL